MFKVCGHCGANLGPKAYKEHKKLFYREGSWLKLPQVASLSGGSAPAGVASSVSSSPINLSVPSQSPGGSIGESSDGDDLCGEAQSHESSDVFEGMHPDSEVVMGECADTEGQPDKMKLEYWDEDDEEVESDIQNCIGQAPTPLVEDQGSETGVDNEQSSVIWWLVVFTCMLQTLHSLPLRAVEWLLKFLSALLTYLGRYSHNIAEIARGFPSTLHLRAKYLQDQVCTIPVIHKVVCPTCHCLYDYKECCEKRGSKTIVRKCSECATQWKQTPLLKTIVTSRGTPKMYPFLVYPYSSLVSTLRSMLLRPGFLKSCEHWRAIACKDLQVYHDVYDGKVWQDFLIVSGVPFLANRFNLALMLNIDWFQPYKHRNYSIGVMYLAIMNLPRRLRYKRENVVLLGLIPGPREPSLTINPYLTPLVSDLLLLWDGISYETYDYATQLIRCALLCVGCDLPAGKKVCGFLSHSANLGCSRCYWTFGTGIFGELDYSGFDRDKWVLRSNKKHRDDVKIILRCPTKTKRSEKESQLGCRYSSLLQLPYFDPIKMTIIDPMHNLYLGTAKHILKRIWMERDILDTDSLKEINKRIASVDIPCTMGFSRLSPTIGSVSSFTAEQMMVWVNFYSLFCLHGLLPSNQLECWRHFVLASRLLSKRHITANEVSVADAFLLNFCSRFESLYGSKAVTPNMHMHGHLTECVKDFGPMNSFWLFSFERYNGLLGSQPTNNRAIEPQLLKRFTEENLNLQLLATANISNDADQVFGPVVQEHAFSFYSLKHLDKQSSDMNLESPDSGITFASKYTIGVLRDHQLASLKEVYHVLYPSLSDDALSLLPSTYRRMTNVSIGGQRLESNQYIRAIPVFEEPTTAVQTLFTNPRERVAKIDHFAVHTLCTSESTTVSHAFAIVDWAQSHASRSILGKPFEVWRTSVAPDSQNYFVPLERVSNVLLSWKYRLDKEEVLITVPIL